MSHTPGPWNVGKHPSEIVTPNKIEFDRPVMSYSSEEEELKHYGGYLIAESVFRKENAHLIAAAPDLLKACQKAYEALEAIAGFCGQNLQVYGWHLNGEPETFDNFIEQNMDGNELEVLYKAILKAKGEHT